MIRIMVLAKRRCCLVYLLTSRAVFGGDLEKRSHEFDTPDDYKEEHEQNVNPTVDQ
jgi:hypothetical protein